jgi:hypothetical protein
LARLWIELKIREAATADHKRIAFFEGLLRWGGPKKADATRGIGVIVRDDRLPKQRLDDGSADLFRQL